MTRMVDFPTKSSTESLALLFDFASQMTYPGDTIASFGASVSLYSGTDTAATGLIISASSVYNATQCYATIQAGIEGNIYLMTGTAVTSSGYVLTQKGYVAIVSALG